MNRDTQFQGFAAALFSDIESMFTNLDLERDDGALRQAEAEDTEKGIKKYIAQRAYDLACHVWDETIGGGNPESVIDGVADLIEFPPEPLNAVSPIDNPAKRYRKPMRKK